MAQQGLPTISKMVEGLPGADIQLMTRLGELFRVARVATEVKGSCSAARFTRCNATKHITNTRDSPSGAPGQLALTERSLGSHSSSPPQVGVQYANFLCTTSRRDGPLLSAEMLQRMRALERSLMSRMLHRKRLWR